MQMRFLRCKLNISGDVNREAQPGQDTKLNEV